MLEFDLAVLHGIIKSLAKPFGRYLPGNAFRDMLRQLKTCLNNHAVVAGIQFIHVPRLPIGNRFISALATSTAIHQSGSLSPHVTTSTERIS